MSDPTLPYTICQRGTGGPIASVAYVDDAAYIVWRQWQEYCRAVGGEEQEHCAQVAYLGSLIWNHADTHRLLTGECYGIGQAIDLIRDGILDAKARIGGAV